MKDSARHGNEILLEFQLNASIIEGENQIRHSNIGLTYLIEFWSLTQSFGCNFVSLMKTIKKNNSFDENRVIEWRMKHYCS